MHADNEPPGQSLGDGVGAGGVGDGGVGVGVGVGGEGEGSGNCGFVVPMSPTFKLLKV